MNSLGTRAAEVDNVAVGVLDFEAAEVIGVVVDGTEERDVTEGEFGGEGVGIGGVDVNVPADESGSRFFLCQLNFFLNCFDEFHTPMRILCIEKNADRITSLSREPKSSWEVRPVNCLHSTCENRDREGNMPHVPVQRSTVKHESEVDQS